MIEPLELGFDLPRLPDAAFAAWTDRAEVTRWWGEEGVYRTTGWTADLCPGGAWRAEFEGDGESFSAEGIYLVVERPTQAEPGRLTWTWRASWSPEHDSTVFMDFAPASCGTRLTVRQSGFADADDRAANAESWPQIIGWLAAHLAASG